LLISQHYKELPPLHESKFNRDVEIVEMVQYTTKEDMAALRLNSDTNALTKAVFEYISILCFY